VFPPDQKKSNSVVSQKLARQGGGMRTTKLLISVAIALAFAAPFVISKDAADLPTAEAALGSRNEPGIF